MRRQSKMIGMLVMAALPAAHAAAAGYDTFCFPLLAPGQTVSLNNQYDPDGINAGQAVGGGSITEFGVASQDALLWTPASATPINLSSSSMVGSIALGTDGTQQVGSALVFPSVTSPHAYLWSGTASSGVNINPTDLNVTSSSAVGIFGTQEVGSGYNSSSNIYHALLWAGTGASAVDLHPTNLSTTFVSSLAVGTDGTNQVGGGTTATTQQLNGFHALLWSGKANTVVDLTPTNYPTLVNSYAYGVSGTQQVGAAYIEQPEDPFATFYDAMLWNGSGASAIILNPTNLNYFVSCKAYGNNNTQQVGVGTTNAATPADHALVWSGSAATAVDLNNYLPINGTWSGSNADRISSTGVIYGTAIGTLNGVSANYATEWLPSNSSSAVVVPGGDVYQFAANTTAAISNRSITSLTINSSGSAIVLPSANSSNRQLIQMTSGLTIAGATGNWTGKLDVGNSDLDLTGDSLATVTSQIAQGYNKGNWNGSGGITSSAAAANTTHLTALGVILNNQSGSPLFTSRNPFDGITPGTSDILVKYTYYGDANLDGKVDGSDYTRIDNGFTSHATGWYNGDFNYDGIINGSDFALIDNSFNTQGANLANEQAAATAKIAATPTAVPEPAIAGVFALAAIALSRRRTNLIRGVHSSK